MRSILLANNNRLISKHSVSMGKIYICTLVFVIAIVMLLQLRFLTEYSPVMIDESWNANTAWTWLTTGINFDAIHHGTLDQFGYEWIRRPYLGTMPWVLSFSILGIGLFQARIVSWVFGILLLGAVILASNQNYSIATGALAALILSVSVPFNRGSVWARQDIMLAAFVMFSFYLSILAVQKEKWWAHIMAGLLLGIGLDVHQNAILFIPGLAALYLVQYRSKFLVVRGTWLAATGVILGIGYYIATHILPSPDAFFNIFAYNYSSANQPPLFTFNLKTILQSIDRSIGIYHFYDNNLEFAIIGMSTAYLLFRRNYNDRLLLSFTIVSFASFILIQGVQAKEDHYAILFYPLFIIVVAETIISLLRESKAIPSQKVAVGVLLFFLVFNSGLHYFRPLSNNRKHDYAEIVARVEGVTASDKTIMGSPLWWLGLREYPYISSLNLSFYHYFNHYDVAESIEEMKPGIVIVDSILASSLDDPTDRNYLYPGAEEEFQMILTERGSKLMQYDSQWYGLVEVYSLDWGLSQGPRNNTQH